MLVVGEEEVNAGVVDVRDRETNQSIGKYNLEDLVVLFESFNPPKSRVEEELDSKALCSEEIVVKQSYSLKEANYSLEM